MVDNSQYLYNLNQEENSVQPDIYFDERDEHSQLSLCRVVLCQLLEASNNSMQSLQILMCLFSGLSLREASKICCVSHEHCRKILEQIRETKPELYAVIKEQKHQVESIIPTLVSKKYKVLDLTSGKTTYYATVKRIAKKYKVDDGAIYMHMQRGSRVPVKSKIMVWRMK